MTTFLHKEHSSSDDQRSESAPSCAEGNNDEFSVPLPPLAADGRSTVKHTDGCQGRGTLANFVGKNDTLSAEILWTLQTISAHYSYKSNEKVRKIFRLCFWIV